MVDGKEFKVSILVCADEKGNGYGLAETTKNGYGPEETIPMTLVFSGPECLSYNEDDYDIMRLRKFYFDQGLMHVVSKMFFKKRNERLQDIMFEEQPYLIEEEEKEEEEDESEEVVDEEADDDDDCKGTQGKKVLQKQLIRNSSSKVDIDVEIYCRFMFLYSLEPKVINKKNLKKKKRSKKVTKKQVKTGKKKIEMTGKRNKEEKGNQNSRIEKKKNYKNRKAKEEGHWMLLLVFKTEKKLVWVDTCAFESNDQHMSFYEGANDLLHDIGWLKKDKMAVFNAGPKQKNKESWIFQYVNIDHDTQHCPQCGPVSLMAFHYFLTGNNDWEHFKNITDAISARGQVTTMFQSSLLERLLEFKNQKEAGIGDEKDWLYLLECRKYLQEVLHPEEEQNTYEEDHRIEVIDLSD